jgi:hypothetical protein
LGVREIWNHLDRAVEIVQNSAYPDVLSREYSDETLSKPIPETIDEDKTLIPLNIRTRVLQKHQNAKRTRHVFKRREYRGEEDEEEEEEEKPEKKPKIKVSAPDDDW